MLYGFAFAQSSADHDRLLTVWAGSLPIILSAPHGGRQAIPGVAARRGIGVAQFTVERDGNTAELAESVGRRIAARMAAKPFLVVASFERKYLDANRPAAMAYESSAAKPYYDAYHGALQEAAAQVRRKWGGGLLLDIHGQGAEAETIFRGTDNGKSGAVLQQRVGREGLIGPKSILGQLAAKGYKIIPDIAGTERERRYRGGYTTQTYGSHRGTKLDVIQLEFGTNLRAKTNLERTAADLAEAIEVFARQYLPLNQTGNGIIDDRRP
jgi:N-formylglutamate amidohydrolase